MEPVRWGLLWTARINAHVERADRYRLQSDNFSRAVRGLEPPLLGREDALGQAGTIDVLYRSADDERTAEGCADRTPGDYFGRMPDRSQTRGLSGAIRSKTPGLDLRSAAKRAPSATPR